MRLVVCALSLFACGGTSEPAKSSSGPAASTIATASGPDDVIVAQVNGRPVWGSCVTTQAHGKTKQKALDECIAFELLAQQAEARGLATHPEVTEATKEALVNRTVELGFEDTHQTPADMKEILDGHVERNKALLSHPEARASTYVRYNLPKDAPPAEDWKARGLLEQFAAKVAPEVGLTSFHLDVLAKGFFGTTPVEVANVPLFTKNGLALGYRDALFAIPEIGRTYPEAVRTQWGWDVILCTDIVPAKTYTREEAAAEAFPEVRRAYFKYWVDQIAKSLGVRVEVDDQALGKLDEERS